MARLRCGGRSLIAISVAFAAFASAAACGQASGSLGTPPDCPTYEQVDEMTSEELNAIPRACDSAGPTLTDSPGVTVSNDDNDDNDGLPTDAARQSFGPPGGSISDTLEKADDLDFWGLEWVGGPIKVLATSKGNLAKVVVADLEGKALLGTEGATAATEVRGSLPAGRYLVKVFFGAQTAAPLNYHVLSGSG